jgi:hypothetical protein
MPLLEKAKRVTLFASSSRPSALRNSAEMLVDHWRRPAGANVALAGLEKASAGRICGAATLAAGTEPLQSRRRKLVRDCGHAGEQPRLQAPQFRRRDDPLAFQDRDSIEVSRTAAATPHVNLLLSAIAMVRLWSVRTGLTFSNPFPSNLAKGA